MYICVYIYIYVYSVCIHIYIYIYIYICIPGGPNIVPQGFLRLCVWEDPGAYTGHLCSVESMPKNTGRK